MKKIILFFICLFFVYSVYGLEIRTNAIIKGVNKKAGFETCFVKDMFYTKQNELFIKAGGNNIFFFLINEDNSIIELDEDSYLENKQEKITYTGEMKYGFYLNVTEDLIAFDKSMINSISRYYTPEKPMFMYINNEKGETVFNFNQWKLNHEEYYPKSYYNSLSEEIFYTEENRERKMKLNAVYTVKDLYCINAKKNKIAIVLDNYNSEGLSALIIFDVLYNATVNDFRVRLRSEPNLSCETLSYFYTGDKVKIIDQTDEPYEIDGERHYWYKVESGTYPLGWVYGKYLDIEECAEEY